MAYRCATPPPMLKYSAVRQQDFELLERERLFREEACKRQKEEQKRREEEAVRAKLFAYEKGAQSITSRINPSDSEDAARRLLEAMQSVVALLHKENKVSAQSKSLQRDLKFVAYQKVGLCNDEAISPALVFSDFLKDFPEYETRIMGCSEKSIDCCRMTGWCESPLLFQQIFIHKENLLVSVGVSGFCIWFHKQAGEKPFFGLTGLGDLCYPCLGECQNHVLVKGTLCGVCAPCDRVNSHDNSHRVYKWECTCCHRFCNPGKKTVTMYGRNYTVCRDCLETFQGLNDEPVFSGVSCANPVSWH